jgi:hypothetical protein
MLEEDKKKTTVTSLRVDLDLWKEAKVEAIRHDLTLGDVVEQALKEWIDCHKESRK